MHIVSDMLYYYKTTQERTEDYADKATLQGKYNPISKILGMLQKM